MALTASYGMEDQKLSPSENVEASLAMASSNKSFDKTKLILPGAIIVAALMISGTLLYADYKSSPNVVDDTKPVKVSVDDDPVLGNTKAKVTIVEFSDFQCPFCRKFWRESYFKIKQNYIDTGKVKLVFRDFPLSFHPAAEPSAQAAQCANEQGKFWEYHDKIFEEQDKRGEATIEYGIAELKQWAVGIGLDSSKFNSCLESNRYADEVAKDFEDGSKYGVSGTPTLFINGKRVVGAQPYEAFVAAIESEL